ncbi:LPXTG cell wall anchor domain-containing protein [Vagococcus sp. BWB3-3]|uniref:LPXTG cell wall anchor domain-containing protein n=1 Tax=Vagococcus allomyrinae TaxID=2794353 RepID=A0A940P3C6_9ENTE|nr:LPXTG cell wall anchor domain-containing protein [Vagococcus allomyrinae]MBP1040265.1 LPXTG cell wall anchor domain-containing protein [Vagococcus allomyrinae]
MTYLKKISLSFGVILLLLIGGGTSSLASDVTVKAGVEFTELPADSSEPAPSSTGATSEPPAKILSKLPQTGNTVSRGSIGIGAVLLVACLLLGRYKWSRRSL